MSPRDDWEATFIPGADVLANELGITDAEELRAAEYVITSLRERRIRNGDIDIPQTFDRDHLHAIHRELFSPIYEWAGRSRTYPMSKGGLPFAEPNQIDRYLAHAYAHVSQVDWGDLDRDGFAVEAATVFASVNTAHPYREGNGRAAKIFMSQLATRAGLRLDFALVNAAQWNSASMLSRPDRGAFEPVPDSLVPVFARIAIPVAEQHQVP